MAAASSPEAPPEGGFTLSWETTLVAAEIAAALGSSLWLLCGRRARQADDKRRPAELALTQPRCAEPPSSSGSDAHCAPWCSLTALLRFRVAAVAFYAGVQLYDLYRTRFLCLVFYTSWNFIAQGVYFAAAAARTRQAQLRARGGYTALLETALPPLSSPRAADAASPPRGRQWISLDRVLDVCLATSILISAVVWTILYPYAVKLHRPETILNPVSYCQHALNVVVLQVDFFCSRHRVSLQALPLVTAWTSVYTVFTWLLHGTIAKGFWPYPFLELNTPYAPLWYGGLLAAHVLALLAVYALSRLKTSAACGGASDAAE